MKMDSKKSKWFLIFAIPAIAVIVTAIFVGAYIIQPPAHIGNNSNNTHKSGQYEIIM